MKNQKPYRTTRKRKPALPQARGSAALGWSYSHYRASLYLDGERFAIVTPDGRNSLSKKDAALLLEALNRKPQKHPSSPMSADENKKQPDPWAGQMVPAQSYAAGPSSLGAAPGSAPEVSPLAIGQRMLIEMTAGAPEHSRFSVCYWDGTNWIFDDSSTLNSPEDYGYRIIAVHNLPPRTHAPNVKSETRRNER